MKIILGQCNVICFIGKPSFILKGKFTVQQMKIQNTASIWNIHLNIFKFFKLAADI